jgi:nitroreductase
MTSGLTAHEVLTTTRAVRRRLDLHRPVARSEVLECIRIASQAPNGRNGQRCRWLVVDDATRKMRLAELWQSSYGQPRAESTKGEPLRRIMASSDYLADILHRVPVLLVPCTLDRPPIDGGEHALADFYGSCLPAVWSFMLAARSRGLGTAWTTQHLAYATEAAEILQIPSTVTQLALVPVAYYTGETFRPAPRRPAEEITYFNSWRSVDAARSVSS